MNSHCHLLSVLLAREGTQTHQELLVRAGVQNHQELLVRVGAHTHQGLLVLADTQSHHEQALEALEVAGRHSLLGCIVG